MQFRQLRYFVKVVEAGSFSRAATTIHVAQPALSQQIAELEDRLGVKLLHRTPRGIRPTAEGETLYREASSILHRLEQLPGLLKSASGEVEGTVSLGLVASVAQALLGPIIEGVRTTLPKVMLKCADGDSETLCARIQANTMDLAIVFEDDLVSGYARSPIYLQRFYLIGKDLPATATSSISLQEIATMPMVLPGVYSERRRLIDRSFSQLRLVPNVRMEADNLSSELSAVRAGVGCTILNVGDLSGSGFEGLASPVIIEPPITMTCSVICSGDFNLSSAGEAIRKLVVQVTRDFVETGRPGALLLDD